MKTRIIKKALEMVNTEGTFSTMGLIDEDGYPFVSVVLSIKNDGLKEFWISSGVSTKKVECIKRNNKTSLCYYDKKMNISLMGTAEVITDIKIKKYFWEDWMVDHYKDGLESTEYCLIKVVIDKARLHLGKDNIDMSIDEINEVTL